MDASIRNLGHSDTRVSVSGILCNFIITDSAEHIGNDARARGARASDGGERSDCRQLAASIRAGSSDSVSHQLVKTTFSVFIRRLFVTEKSHATALSQS